jgi:acyl-CoA synthetase (NDP forming)
LSEVVTAGAAVDLSRLLAPRSVAVVGASDRPGSYGAQTLENLAALGFPGRIWGVNPGRAEVLGHRCVPSVADLPEAVDAVVVAVPAAAVPEVIEQAGERGCGGAVVFGAGFAEAPGGAEHQRALVAAAERHGLPVCGPNCDGIVAMHARSALWGDAFTPREPGHVALVAQSGNVAVNALNTRRGLRLHTVIASGNQAVLSAADYLEYLAGADDLAVVALYLEDDCGPRICEGLGACAAAGIRVVVLKVGSSPIGARAATAHSAALAGDQRVFRALMEEAGAIWAEDVHELLELSKTLAVRSAHPPARGLAIMTCSGGDSAQGADEADRLGLELPDLAPQTLERLRTVLPSAATAANPLDYTAMLWGEHDSLSQLVRILGDDPLVGQVMVFYDEPAGLTGAMAESWRSVREGIAAGALASAAATMTCSTLPELLEDEAAWQFAEAGIPAAAGLRTGLRCAAAMRAPAGDPARLHEIAAAAAAHASGQPAARPSEWLAPHLAMDLLGAGGISVVQSIVVADEEQAVKALSDLGGELALKLSAAAIQHKSEVGGVRLGLSSEAEVRGAHRELSALAARFRGCVTAEPMAPGGVELLVAARADSVVPALIIGLGGIWTELLHDVAVVPLPAPPSRVERAIASLRGAPLLRGGRGLPPVDLAAACRLAQRVGELLLESRAQLIEINPVLVHEDGALALDASVRGSCTT